MLRRNPREHKEPGNSVDSDPFDPQAEYVTHTRIGVWDLYEDERSQKGRVPSSSFLQKFDEALTSLPFVIRAAKAMTFRCYNTLTIYLIASLVHALIPATSLYYSGQLLHVVQQSIDTRSVDKTVLFRVLFCRIACAALERLSNLVTNWASMRIGSKMRSYYAEHILHAHVRLDVPTFTDPAIRSQLSSAVSTRTNVAWAGIQAVIRTASIIIHLVTQFFVLISVLKDQPDGSILALMSFAEPILMWARRSSYWDGGVWAATCRNEDYVRMQGFKSLVDNEDYRKELVAGNLQEYIVSEFRTAQKHVGDDGDLSFREARHQLRQRKESFSFLSFLGDPLHELPQVIFTLRAVQSPHTIPVSLASLTLIRQSVSSFSMPLIRLLEQTSSMSETFASIRQLYEMINVKNQVDDGNEPYPEDKRTLRTGIAIEFKDVSFRYPGNESYAIRHVSFKIETGQLCVLVGFNGSGKSTILKLLNRLYDPTEGIILIDGRDIRNLRLTDLRRCVSVLFQDYTHFPLSIKENIGMGDPQHAKDEDRIRQAAELGGATQIIENLPEGFDTLLTRPVPDHFSGIQGTRSLFGRQVDYGHVKRRMGTTQNLELSGGQMQRLAVSRTFMRSLGSESDVGLLLFDEPSASLDPAAEHDLFERLRQLRGNKTMVFSTHRFGQLTRHADQILYMADSTVLELGTHEELIKRNGGYARMYNIQAAQFQ